MQTQIFTSFNASDFRSLVAETVTDAVRKEIDRIHEPASVEKKYLTRRETATILGISLPTLHHRTTTGEILSYRLGSSIRYKASEIERSLTPIRTKF